MEPGNRSDVRPFYEFAHVIAFAARSRRISMEHKGEPSRNDEDSPYHEVLP